MIRTPRSTSRRCSAAHQGVGIEVLLLREEDAAVDLVGQQRLVHADVVADQHLRIAVEPPGQVEMAQMMLEVLLVGEGHQQPVVGQLVVDAVGPVVLVRLDRALGQPQMRLEAGALALAVQAPPHPEHELDEHRIQRRPDVERAVAVQHPLQRLADHPGSGDRGRLGRTDPAGVHLGGSAPGLPGVDHGDVGALAGQVVRADQPDGTAADDDDALHPQLRFGRSLTVERVDLTGLHAFHRLDVGQADRSRATWVKPGKDGW